MNVKQLVVYSIALCALILTNGIVAQAEEPAKAPKPNSELTSSTPAAVDTPLYMNPFEVIVTAPRQNIPLKLNPAATTVVSMKTLKNMPRGIAVDEALKLVPGVRIDNQADGERVHLSIRGQGILTERGIRGIKVLLDGMPLNDPTGVAPDFYDVDWATTQRIEVLRGPAAALYGGGSSGGVVNITTQDGNDRPTGAEVSTVTGSHGFWKTLGQLDGTVQNMKYRISASRMMGDGYRQHTAFWANNIYSKIHYNASPDIHLTQILGWTDYFDQNAEGLTIDQVNQNPRQANPDAFTYNEYYKTSRLTTGLIGSAQLAPDHQLQFSGYFRLTRYKEPVPDDILHRDLLAPGATVQYNFQHGSDRWKNHISLGTDIQWQTIDENRVENLGNAEEGALLSNERIVQRGAGVFLLDRVDVGKDWAVMGSVRYDDIRNELTDFFHGDSSYVNASGSAAFRKATGRIGLAFTPMAKLNLYGNWGQGFLPPATEELANNPDRFGGFNRHLAPATSMGEEIGARGLMTKDLSYDLTFFNLTTDKDFDRYRVNTRLLETFYRNTGSTRRYGIESLLIWHPIHPLTMSVSYTYSDFKYTKPEYDVNPDNPNAAPYKLKGNWLPNSPQHQSFAEVEYEVLPHLSVAISNEVQTRWYVDSRNSASVNGFTLWGARLGYEWRLGRLNGDIMLTGRNLFDRKYIAFTEPDPDGNSYQPGPTHEVFGSVRIRI